jgi:hypothetical protein
MSDLNYPKNGGAYLLQRIHEMHAQVADLIDELVRRDQEIALLKAQIVVTKPDADNSNPPQ